MRALLALALLLAFAAPAAAAPTLAPLASFTQPTYATAAPGDDSRIYVTEQPGRVRLLVDGVVQAAPFLDLSAITETNYEERGLLSVAFPPDYQASGRFYVYLTVTAAAAVSGTDGEIQVRAYQRSATNPNLADPASGRILLHIQHTDAQNHDGGQLQFGPDGQLWLGTGDGGGGNDQFHHSQDPNSLLGKLIRLDVAQAAPAPEVLARGLRNPWRFSFDPSGRIVIADVGQDQVEEIDVGLALNYGWPCMEGDRVNTGFSDAGCAGGGTAPPFLTHTHGGDGFCSITGGYVITDPGLPTLQGRYVYGDYCKGDIYSVEEANAASDTDTGLHVEQLSSFGVDACGRILVTSLSGTVYRLVDGAPSACAAPGGGGSAPPPRDTRPAHVAMNVTGLRSLRKRHYLTVTLRPDERCRLTVRAARFRTVTRTLAANQRARVKLRLTARGRRSVRRALRRHQRPRIAIRLRTTDAAGNPGTYTRKVRVRG
jgi:Glucose / Sorbosone dehydrogenase